jgi:hypothetical protein
MPARAPQRRIRYGVYRRLSSPSLTVHIDQQIIDHSMRRDSAHCMISEALRQLLPTATGLSVDLATIRLTDPAKKLRYVYLTPRQAQIALIDYDRGINPKPFAFRLHRAVQVTRGRAVAVAAGTVANNRRTQNLPAAAMPTSPCAACHAFRERGAVRSPL